MADIVDGGVLGVVFQTCEYNGFVGGGAVQALALIAAAKTYRRMQERVTRYQISL
jgi:hypothetical protein